VFVGSLASGNFDAFSSTSCNINHPFEMWMIKGLDQLNVRLRTTKEKIREIIINIPDQLQ
jgi:hypothetical protein